MIAFVPSPGGDEYASLLAKLNERIHAAQLRAAVAVNQKLILLYWGIGRDILDRKTKADWSAEVIDRLPADLRRGFPEMKGLSP